MRRARNRHRHEAAQNGAHRATKEDEVPQTIDHLIEETPKGVKVELKRLYVYPDGAAFLLFADGTEWPMGDGVELLGSVANGLLKPMYRKARKLHPPGRSASPQRRAAMVDSFH
jgi:hypothetical protein